MNACRKTKLLSFDDINNKRIENIKRHYKDIFHDIIDVEGFTHDYCIEHTTSHNNCKFYILIGRIENGDDGPLTTSTRNIDDFFRELKNEYLKSIVDTEILLTENKCKLIEFTESNDDENHYKFYKDIGNYCITLAELIKKRMNI